MGVKHEAEVKRPNNRTPRWDFKKVFQPCTSILFREPQGESPTWPDADNRSTAEGCCEGRSCMTSGVPGQVEGVMHSSIQLESVMGVKVPSRLRLGYIPSSSSHSLSSSPCMEYPSRSEAPSSKFPPMCNWLGPIAKSLSKASFNKGSRQGQDISPSGLSFGGGDMLFDDMAGSVIGEARGLLAC